MAQLTLQKDDGTIAALLFAESGLVRGILGYGLLRCG